MQPSQVGKEVWNWGGSIPLTLAGPVVLPLPGALLGLRVDMEAPFPDAPPRPGPDYCSAPDLQRGSCPSTLVGSSSVPNPGMWFLVFPLRLVLSLFSRQLPLVNRTTLPACESQAA